jgi:hypothetical protein
MIRRRMSPPKPLTCIFENGRSVAAFDYNELKRWAEDAVDPSFVVRDDEGNVAGVAKTSLMRELFWEKAEGACPTSLPALPESPNQSFRNE